MDNIISEPIKKATDQGVSRIGHIKVYIWWKRLLSTTLDIEYIEIQRAYAHQYAYPESEPDPDQEGEDINIDNNQVESADNASDMSSD